MIKIKVGHKYIEFPHWQEGLCWWFCGKKNPSANVGVVHLHSHVRLSATTRTTAHQASLSITNSQSLLKLMSMGLVMPSYHLILCCPLLLLPSIFPSIRVFSNEWTLHIKWPKYWNFSFSISLSTEYSGLISFRIDWFDLLAVQGTLKSLLQHHNMKASIFWCSIFIFCVYMFHIYIYDPVLMVFYLSHTKIY